MDHGPGEVGGANEELYIVKRAQRDQGPMAFIAVQLAAEHMHGESSDIPRERYDQVMRARLPLVVVLGLCP